MMENGLVIVTGMELPENCYHCRFNYDRLCHALQCSFYNYDGTPREMKGGRLVNCPLKSVLPTEPAVPQEMSAKELLHAERRMYNEDSDAYLEYSSLVIEEEMESALCYIEAWAKEHPERSEDDGVD